MCKRISITVENKRCIKFITVRVSDEKFQKMQSRKRLVDIASICQKAVEDAMMEIGKDDSLVSSGL